MTIACYVDRPLLSIVCVGSIHSMINFSLCEKLSKVLDLSIVRGEGRAPEINVTKSAIINELKSIYCVDL